MKKLFSYFLQGLLYITPIGITIYAVVLTFQFVDGLLPTEIPGLGILIMFAAITLIGYLATTYIAQALVTALERLMGKAPLVKLIYTSVRDLLSAFMGKEKRFDRPVIVTVGRDSGLKKLGFVTQEDLSKLGLPDDQVAVYLPHSYNFSGNLFIVPAAGVEALDAPAADVMKFIVSGGVSG